MLSEIMLEHERVKTCKPALRVLLMIPFRSHTDSINSQ